MHLSLLHQRELGGHSERGRLADELDLVNLLPAAELDFDLLNQALNFDWQRSEILWVDAPIAILVHHEMVSRAELKYAEEVAADIVCFKVALTLALSEALVNSISNFRIVNAVPTRTRQPGGLPCLLFVEVSAVAVHERALARAQLRSVLLSLYSPLQARALRWRHVRDELHELVDGRLSARVH